MMILRWGLDPSRPPGLIRRWVLCLVRIVERARLRFGGEMMLGIIFVTLPVSPTFSFLRRLWGFCFPFFHIPSGAVEVLAWRFIPLSLGPYDKSRALITAKDNGLYLIVLSYLTQH